MRWLIIATIVVLLGCSCSRNEDKGSAADRPARVKLTGKARETLSNGIFTAHLEKMEQDLEDETGITPGELVFRFHVVIGNAGSLPLVFDTIAVMVLDAKGHSHVNTVQRGEEGQLEEIVLLAGQGAGIVATVPQASILLPNKCVVLIKHKGVLISDILSFDVDEKDFKIGKALMAKKAKGGLLTKSSVIEYDGALPLDLFKKADAVARGWNSKAELREVRGGRFEMYGDQDTGNVSMIKVTEWQYTFVADGKALVVLVSSETESSSEQEEAYGQVEKLLPIEKWTVDVDAAIKTAAAKGTKARTGPWLRVFNVSGTQTPLWVIPGVKGCLVDALTGEYVDQSSLILP